jgi:CRP/FNR family transcriptional regulator, cyclic AMP receptor protein
MSNQELVPQLRAVDLFSGLSDKALAGIAELGALSDHPAGSVLAEQDRSGVGFHLLLSGTADVTVNGESRGTLKPGDHFGEIALIDGEPRSASVVVGPDGARTFSLTSWKFAPLLDQHPEMTRSLLTSMCARLRRAEALLDHRG